MTLEQKAALKYPYPSYALYGPVEKQKSMFMIDEQRAAYVDGFKDATDILGKAIKLMQEGQFNDCFMYECSSQNECQAFGCIKRRKINEIKNNPEQYM